jgi:hypothetical protein
MVLTKLMPHIFIEVLRKTMQNLRWECWLQDSIQEFFKCISGTSSQNEHAL